MRVVVAGGSGFLGSALVRSLRESGQEVSILTRRPVGNPNEISWDGRSVDVWAASLEGADAVVNLTGYGLEHWPWNAGQKRHFVLSRVEPGVALASAIEASAHRPRVFIQVSGINFYGLRGAGIADESTAAASDYLAQLAVQWEAATRSVEDLGIRRVVARSAVVLAANGGLFPLMALPVRLMIGGPLGNGRQAVPWIHLADQVRALRFLMENEQATGAFNLIAPQATSNEDFMRAVAGVLHRPYWLRTPGILLRLALGEMSDLVLEGRYSRPMRLEKMGFQFAYPTIQAALSSLLKRS